MNAKSSIIAQPKKKPWLGNPSTTILRNVDVHKLGVFAVIGGPKIGFAFSLNQDEESIIGSGPDSNIKLDCRGISRDHCRIYWLKNEIYIEDLDSLNGTRVNKRKINSPIKLSSGDQIAIGATTVIKCS